MNLQTILNDLYHCVEVGMVYGSLLGKRTAKNGLLRCWGKLALKPPNVDLMTFKPLFALKIPAAWITTDFFGIKKVSLVKHCVYIHSRLFLIFEVFYYGTNQASFIRWLLLGHGICLQFYDYFEKLRSNCTVLNVTRKK